MRLAGTCDADQVHLITRVATTPAAVADVARTAAIHDAPAGKGVLPCEHPADAGYVDGPLLVTSRAEHGIDLVGPVRPYASWQAQQGQGDDVAAFAVAWAARLVTCPQGRTSATWVPHEDRWGIRSSA